jgi:hypothetical protein
VDFQDRQRSVEEEAFFTQKALFLAKPSWRHAYGESAWSTSLYGTAKRQVNKETQSTPWSRGLYDYEEFGGGASLERKGGFGADAWSLDASWSHRGYVNLHNDLAAASAKPALNYYTKDIDITKVALGTEFGKKTAFSLGADLNWSYRRYPDGFQYSQTPTDIYDYSVVREDQLSQLILKGAFRPMEHWVLGLDGAAFYQHSNQNLFDPVATRQLDDYYSYRQGSLKPALTWLSVPGPKGHSATLSYQGLWRDYVHRRVRDKSGNDLPGTQADVEQSVGLSGRASLDSLVKGLGLYLNTNWLFARSNQSYEPVVRYSYEIFTSQLGFSYTY